MRALTIVGDHLVVAERHVDEPAADQLVVEVAGAGINRGDLLQVAGRQPPPRSEVTREPQATFAAVGCKCLLGGRSMQTQSLPRFAAEAGNVAPQSATVDTSGYVDPRTHQCEAEPHGPHAHED